MIHVENVCKTYRVERNKPVSAVQQLSLDVADGEIYGFIGPNGAGKSTTIKLLLDIIRPDCGLIEINGITSKNAASRAKVGYLPENPYLYDFLTAVEYIYHAGKLSALDNATIINRRTLLLEKLKLRQAEHRQLKTYSKGMQQRAAIAASLIHDPQLVIMDEPMSGLDPLGRKLVFDLIAELKEQGKTIFICSHVLTDIERICDRVGIIVKGKLSFQEATNKLNAPLDDLFLKVVENEGIGEVC